MSPAPLHLTVTLADGVPVPPGRRAQELAQAAERCGFDAVWLAGTPLDPLPLLGSLIAVTERIGLGALWPVDHAEPYHVARVFATLDHLSGGRTAWIVGLSDTEFSPMQFDHATVPLDGEPYLARAAELMETVGELWDSWEDEGWLLDVASGRFAAPERVHPIDHSGRFFAVRGPLNVPRPVQGNPPLAMALPADAALRALAYAHAEILLVADAARDLSALKRDVEDGIAAAGRTGRVRVLLDIASPASDAEGAFIDRCESLRAEGWDGINLAANDLAAFETVVPFGQARGLFRTEYEGTTLRDHFRLSRPRSRFAAR